MCIRDRPLAHYGGANEVHSGDPGKSQAVQGTRRSSFERVAMALRAPLPTGTVTLLFTDIEGSTQHWEEQSAAMSDALRRHDELLRAAIEAHGGYVFKTTGDGFCAAFPRASDAVAAAIDAQRALATQDWGTVGRCV